MLKSTFLILVVTLTSGNIRAQQIIDSIHPYFSGKLKSREINERYDNFEIAIPTKKPANTKLYNDVGLAVFHSNNLYVNTVFNRQGDVHENKDLFDFTIPGSYAQITGSYKNTSAVPLFDSLPVVVTAYGINAANKHLYRFRVLKNKTEEIIPWSMIRFFTPVFMHFRYNVDGSEQTQMAYLGEFYAEINNSITVEVKNLQLPDTVYSISAAWKQRAPEIIATFTSQNLQAFVTVYKYRWKNDRYGSEGPSYYGDISLPPVDSLLLVRQEFAYNENNLLFYLNDKVKSADLIEYNLISEKDSTGWRSNDFDANVISLRQLSPGKYTLYLRYAFQRQTVNSFSFKITPAWYQTIWFKSVAGMLFVLACMSVYFFIKSRRQKIKMKEQQTLTRLAQAEIKSIKSQFNPHFVFNALSSIQGLITKNDIESAHIYLGDFSQLLRNSLKESEKDFISLAKDIHLIERYLKLEQLRFGFHYQINIDKKINKDTVEVPVLLLQPAIENAIKHGISGLHEKGILKIDYTANENDITITVTDNGAGYNNNTENGRGLKLTDERIALINKLLKVQSVHWRISNTGKGTQVIYVFKNWLL